MENEIFKDLLNRFLKQINEGQCSDEEFLASAENDNERELFNSICSEINYSNSLISDWVKSGKPEIAEWTVGKLLAIAKDKGEEDEESLKEQITNAIDKFIENESKRIIDALGEEKKGEEEK